MQNIPSGRGAHAVLSLVAFISVLITGILLVTFGHLTAGGLATASTALVALYAGWTSIRRSEDSRRKAADGESDGEQEDS